MTSKKLGSLLRSVPPATVSAVTEPAPAAQTPAIQAVSKSVRAAALPIEPEVPLQVLIPAGVRKQLALKAADEGQSLRALVLQGLRSLGITVTDADIKGKRGRQRT